MTATIENPVISETTYLDVDPTQTTVTPVDAPLYRSQYSGSRVNFPRIVRSEWLKLWSLRSTWWVAALTIALMAGLAFLFASVLNTALNNPESAARMGGSEGASAMLNGTLIVTVGYQFAQLTVAILGVLSITNEYTSGMIRATLGAAPRRLRVLLAKLLVLATTTLIISAIGLALSWLVTLPILNNHNLAVDFSDSISVRSFVGVLLYLLAIAVFSLGLGALIRHTAGAIAAVVSILMVLPGIMGIIVMTADAAWAQTIYRYLPTEAGEQLINQTSGGMGPGGGGMGGMASLEMLEPWPGFAVLAGYAVLAFIAAMIAIRKRDA